MTALATPMAFAQEDAINPADDIAKPSSSNILGLQDADLKSGNVNLDSIPIIIASLIRFGTAIAGTISILMLIYFAVQMQLKSGITGDTTGVEQAKKGMFASAIGFMISISAWFIMARVIDLLSTASS